MNVNIKGHIIRPGLPTVYYTNVDCTIIVSVGYIVLLVDCTLNPINITLTTSTNNIDCIVVKKIDSTSNTLTVTPGGGSVDDSSVATIKVQYTSITLLSDGIGRWNII